VLPLKELGRIVKTRGVQALHPHTDAEIAIKLRMAGFSKAQISKTLSRHSPFVKTNTNSKNDCDR
jgi:hypothetical protein